MIQKQSKLSVADNSGAKKLQCIHIVGSTRKRFAYVGDLIVCAVKQSIPGGSVKKGDVVLAIIVRVKKEHQRDDGGYINFSDNAAVLIKKEDQQMVGTRIFGPVARDIRDKHFPPYKETEKQKKVVLSDLQKSIQKIFSLAEEVL